MENDSAKSEKRLGRITLESWLDQTMKIQMTDGRIVIGTFLCTDKDKNIILGGAYEYVTPISKPNDTVQEENKQDGHQACTTRPSIDANKGPRNLGLAMVPGNYIVSIHLESSGQKLRENSATVKVLS